MKKKFYLLMTILIPFSYGMGQKSINQDSLRKDFKLLKEVLESYHPGLYRFKNPKTVERDFKLSEQEFIKSKDLKEAYLSLHRATTKIQCGHTYPNFWNQEKEVRIELFEKDDKLPFTTNIIKNTILINKNLSQKSIETGAEIIAINGIKTRRILDELKRYRRLDGNNMNKFYANFSITGIGKYEAFDIIFPLLFPPIENHYSIDLKSNDTYYSVKVKSVSRKYRSDKLLEKDSSFGNVKSKLWQYSFLEDSIARLKIGTFAVWDMKLDWKKFLNDFFSEAKTKKSKYLLLDLRGNEGGLMEVYRELLSYLTTKPLEIRRYDKYVRYSKAKEIHRPFLETWNESIYDLTDEVVQNDDYYFEFKDDTYKFFNIVPNPYAFDGKIYMLINADNSSATYYLGNYLKKNKLATLIGETTGGNQKGTNGGEFFMLKLPYTSLEVDIPLIGYYPIDKAKDTGLSPDIFVERNLNYFYNKWKLNKDLDISAFYEDINLKRTNNEKTK